MDQGQHNDDVARIERSMRSFRRLGNAQRVQQQVHEITGVDLDPSAYLMLVSVNDEGPIRLTALASALWLDISVVSRKLRLLEDRGLAERADDPDDARAVRVSVTPAGAALVQRVLAERSKFLTRILEPWSDADRTRFATLFDRFMDDVVTGYNDQAATPARAPEA